MSTAESTSRPPSRAQRLSEPLSRSPPSGPRIFSSTTHTFDEVRAQVRTFDVQLTTPFPGSAPSSTSSPQLPHYIHNPPMSATNATAYRVGLQPTSNPSVPAYQAAATAALSIPLFVPSVALTSTTSSTTAPPIPLPVPHAASDSTSTAAPAITAAPSIPTIPSSTDIIPPHSTSTTADVGSVQAISQPSEPAAPAKASSSTKKPTSAKATPKAKPARKAAKASSSKSAKALGKERAVLTPEAPSQPPKDTASAVREAIPALFGFEDAEFAELLSKAVSSAPKVGRVLTVGIGDLLGVKFRPDAVRAMMQVGWDPVYWVREADGVPNPDNLPKAKAIITKSMKEKWLEDPNQRAVLEELIFGSDGGWVLLNELRECNLDATAFHATTSWDSGGTQQAPDIADTAIMMFSSTIGGRCRVLLPQVMERVAGAVNKARVRGTLAGEPGFSTSKMLPYGTYDPIYGMHGS